MAVQKAEVVSARVPRDVKAALSAVAEIERSVASMLEIMVLGYCRDHGIITPPVKSTGQRHSAASRK